MVVVVMVVVVIVLVVMIGATLTGWLAPHSTSGLAVIPAAVTAGSDLDQVVGEDHPDLGGEGRVVC